MGNLVHLSNAASRAALVADPNRRCTPPLRCSPFRDTLDFPAGAGALRQVRRYLRGLQWRGPPVLARRQHPVRVCGGTDGARDDQDDQGRDPREGNTTHTKNKKYGNLYTVEHTRPLCRISKADFCRSTIGIEGTRRATNLWKCLHRDRYFDEMFR